MIPRVRITAVRGTASATSLVHVVQHFTGLTLPEAQRVIERAAAGERVELELDDEYAAYDFAALLTDLGATAAVAED
ncbi:MAG TPA: hypothetical protein VFQ45_01775 [Longimicrobium sp.]|nr:hypothetical protein [Longimicrobium sp.]